MKPSEQVDEAMGRALCARLRNEGRRIASTVAPKEWTPIDADLEEEARHEAKWMGL